MGISIFSDELVSFQKWIKNWIMLSGSDFRAFNWMISVYLYAVSVKILIDDDGGWKEVEVVVKKWIYLAN